MPRRCPIWVVLLAAGLHAFGIARSSLPAQDGLKFLRVARQFHAEPWLDVVRNSDHHPLYPASIAAIEPILSRILGEGPDTWRLAGQVVSAIASILILFPLYSLTRSLFNDHATATLAALLWVLLPIPAEVGRDTLADSLALLGTVSGLWLGDRALRTGDFLTSMLCAIACGLGYLARPEVAIVPVVILGVAGFKLVRRLGTTHPVLVVRPENDGPSPTFGKARFVVPVIAFLAMVGSYAILKGEVSEKLSIRRAVGLPSPHDTTRAKSHPLPTGLDGPEWDFSPKEESTRSAHFSTRQAAIRVLNGWIEAMGWAFAVFAIWAVVRGNSSDGHWLIAAYVAIFTAILIRHATTLGYASTRHTLSIAAATLPWGAAGALICGRRIASLARLDDRWTIRGAGVLLASLLAVGIGSQIKKAPHDGRWGFGAAGKWLAANMIEGDSVLDTRGWARFVSEKPGYDYWHIGQALSDARLAFVVVESSELSAQSRRARSLRAVLDFACEPVAAFPSKKGETTADVLVYRYHRPESWEGLRP